MTTNAPVPIPRLNITRHGPLAPLDRGDRVRSLLDDRTGTVCTRTLGMPLRSATAADEIAAVQWDGGAKMLSSRSLLAKLRHA